MMFRVNEMHTRSDIISSNIRSKEKTFSRGATEKALNHAFHVNVESETTEEIWTPDIFSTFHNAPDTPAAP